MSSSEQTAPSSKVSILPRIVAILIGLIGATLFAGGIWLAILGGSLYYGLTGAALLASAYFIFRGKALGAWIYVSVYMVTVPWALWESGNDPWALVPRLVGPTVLLALVSPRLYRPTRWPVAPAGAGGAVVFLAVALWVASASRPDPVRGELPIPRAGIEVEDVGGDWPAWGGTHSGQRYSQLDQITPANVGGLERAWIAHTGDLPQGAGEGKYAPRRPRLKSATVCICARR